MTYVRHRGTPDLFITFTCNPSWPEITVELLPGHEAVDRVDLVARVFQQKVQKMMHVMMDVQVYGKVACFMYSIEWQKRGLPHMHLLVWLQTKIRPDQVDCIISAEIPDEEEDPILYEVVTKKHDSWPFLQ
ncbi:helitron_like_N domain-containing protein [Trichonephila clavata]|uniref:Helitron_like_N domain-containing protein n=1 Tax=Trichonephila clavata TaxID=2740835 RepID=A0A8X6HDZ8_TRICU|nr:helitron_like_N domain-containing protein [Trichonephila clavata]